jgi:chromosome segregation ATPase
MFGISKKEHTHILERLAAQMDHILELGKELTTNRLVSIQERDTLQSRIDEAKAETSKALVRIETRDRVIIEHAKRLKALEDTVDSSNPAPLCPALNNIAQKLRIECQRYKAYNEKLISKLAENRETRNSLANQCARLLDGNKAIRDQWQLQQEIIKDRDAEIKWLRAELTKLKGEGFQQSTLQGS